jgi:hypothetical protein
VSRPILRGERFDDARDDVAIDRLALLPSRGAEARGGDTIEIAQGFVNDPRHQRAHRRVVRAETPVVRAAAAAPVTASAIALTTTTTAPTYTRRPRNRNEGGMARCRHPSRPQQRLKRRLNASAAGATSPPRGLRR